MNDLCIHIGFIGIVRFAKNRGKRIKNLTYGHCLRSWSYTWKGFHITGMLFKLCSATSFLLKVKCHQIESIFWYSKGCVQRWRNTAWLSRSINGYAQQERYTTRPRKINGCVQRDRNITRPSRKIKGCVQRERNTTGPSRKITGSIELKQTHE